VSDASSGSLSDFRLPASACAEHGDEITRSISPRTDSSENEGDLELLRMNSKELEQQAIEFSRRVTSNLAQPAGIQNSGSNLLVDKVLGKDQSGSIGHEGVHHKKKGAFAGVFVPTCENMWGVLIFLRFYFIVGHAGVGQALCAVLLSFVVAFCTTSSMCAIVSSGGLVSEGGPYHMISRALGPCIGASVGVMYWLAITLLAVLEVLGAVEGVLMAAPKAEFGGCKQAYGSGMMALLVLFVWGGITFVTKLGVFFVFVVFFTLFSYYYGICVAPTVQEAQNNPWVTGLDLQTLELNWFSHYGSQNGAAVTFGVVLSVFFPCFTGILSGANRADVLRDPPKNIRQGTFGAIIFSLLMYSSFMILWGMVAEYPYLQGEERPVDHGERRLAGGSAGAHLVEEIVWNPFPHSAHAGIIISSLSQALQCLIVAPRLLQKISQDRIINALHPLAPLSKKGEPVRALFATYVVAGCLVLLGELDMVAPLLTMCFLVAYAMMNISCFCLTWLNSTAFRPKGIQKKRWRCWYLCTGGLGFLTCLSIMFTVNIFWALGAIVLSLSLYSYINWKLEAKEWGSAMDGIRFNLALNSLIQLEASQHQHVNWRPQVLILYRVHLAEELRGIKHHEILRFYSQLRKGNGFCVVACVLESDTRDQHSLRKAAIEKGIIKTIMKEESIPGFAEVVVAPSWSEGTNYIIQLTGVGGLSPNTVMLDWPDNWQNNSKKSMEFVSVLQTSLAERKAVLAVKGLVSMPMEPVYGTIDVWWMIHDGGFLILLSWLLVQHRVWRKCHLRVFTITEGVSEGQAKNAAEMLTKTLRHRRLFDVDVEVIIADDELLKPYSYDSTLRAEERHKFLERAQQGQPLDLRRTESIPLEIQDLFQMESVPESREMRQPGSLNSLGDHSGLGHIVVSDARRSSIDSCHGKSAPKSRPAEPVAKEQPPAQGQAVIDHGGDEEDVLEGSKSENEGSQSEPPPSPSQTSSSPRKRPHSRDLLHGMVGINNQPAVKEKRQAIVWDETTQECVDILNQIIFQRSKRAELVVVNLPELWGDTPDQVHHFMSYCEALTRNLERVLFVHATGQEIFDISS